MTAHDPAPLTTLLDRAAHGDRAAFDRAYALLYDELSALAHAQRRRWTGNDTLGTSVLVHEAYLKLLGPDPSPGDDEEPTRWTGRTHFFALAARVMRQVLVNYAEAQQAAKRGGSARVVPLDAADAHGAEPDPAWLAAREAMPPESAEEVLRLHAALARLEARDARQARIVECRFFAGLSIPATAEALGISPATVKREWAAARDWLHAELAQRGGAPET